MVGRWRSGSKIGGWSRKSGWRRVWSRPSRSPRVLRAAAATRPTWAGPWGLTRAPPRPPSPPPRKVPLARSRSLSCLSCFPRRNMTKTKYVGDQDSGARSKFYDLSVYTCSSLLYLYTQNHASFMTPRGINMHIHIKWSSVHARKDIDFYLACACSRSNDEFPSKIIYRHLNVLM